MVYNTFLWSPDEQKTVNAVLDRFKEYDMKVDKVTKSTNNVAQNNCKFCGKLHK